MDRTLGPGRLKKHADRGTESARDALNAKPASKEKSQNKATGGQGRASTRRNRRLETQGRRT